MAQPQMTINIVGMNEVKTLLRDFSPEKVQKYSKGIQNSIAYNTQQRLKTEVAAVFDRPIPRTKSAVYYNKKDEPTQVKIRDEFGAGGLSPNRWLWPQVHGGKRGLKAHEKLLNDKGFLPDGMHCVPGYNAKLNSYGNQSPGEIVQILSALRAFPEVGNLMNQTGRRPARIRKGNWLVIPGNRFGMGGVFLINGDKVLNLLNFIRPVNYQKRFDFYGVGIGYINSNFSRLAGEYVQFVLDRNRGR